MEEKDIDKAQKSMDEIVSSLRPLSKNTVYTGQLLDKAIDDEVYEKVKVKDKLSYPQYDGIEEIEKKIETDSDFKEEYKKEMGKKFQAQGFHELEVYEIDTESKYLHVEYVTSYLGRREYPEIHLKTLLLSSEADGNDIYNQKVFDEVVEKAKDDLKTEKNGERVDHFASLFWKAFLESDSPTIC